MEENDLLKFPPIQKFPKKFQIFPAPRYKIWKKLLAPQKKYLWLRVYTMENKDTKTEYQEVVTVGNQKWWEMAEITFGIIFFVWDAYSLFFYICRELSGPTEKNHTHPNCQFPPKMPIWSKSLPYKPSEKWLSLPSITQGECNLWNTSGYVNVYF